MIYLDHAATTYVYPEVIDGIAKIMSEQWGNPSAIYEFGIEAKQIVEEARKKVAKAIKASPSEIFFTSCSTEGNAWAIAQRKNCWCSQFEHHSVSENKNTQAIVDINFMRAALEYQKKQRELAENDDIFPYNHVIFSHMLVNNETGEMFVDELSEYASLAHQMGMLVHTDGTQALGNIDIDIHSLPVDIATFSGHKVHAPKGVGFIYFNKKTVPLKEIKPFFFGGAQERGVRAGTENTPYIWAIGESVSKACKKAVVKKKQKHCLALQKALFDELMKPEEGLPDDFFTIITPKHSVPSTLMLGFKGVEGQVLTSVLSEKGIYLGNGSACNSGDLEPSDTLKALQISEEYINGPVRFSFDITNTEKEIRTVAKELKTAYKELANFS